MEMLSFAPEWLHYSNNSRSDIMLKNNYFNISIPEELVEYQDIWVCFGIPVVKVHHTDLQIWKICYKILTQFVGVRII